MKVEWTTVAMCGIFVAGGLAALLTGHLSPEAFTTLIVGLVSGAQSKQMFSAPEKSE